MSLARPIIEERMLQYEDNQIQFNLLSLCRDPLLTVQDDLSANILAICAVEQQLQLVKPDWKSFVDEQESDNTLRGLDVFYKITPEKLENAKMHPSITEVLNDPATTASQLFDKRKELADAQTRLRAAFVEESSNIRHDDQRAMDRRFDYTPLINMWIRMLAENEKLKDLVETSMN
jgi:ubiquitin carboxyl-terminal hydrolase L5